MNNILVINNNINNYNDDNIKIENNTIYFTYIPCIYMKSMNICLKLNIYIIKDTL